MKLGEFLVSVAVKIWNINIQYTSLSNHFSINFFKIISVGRECNTL